jgi:hypothetical protein
MSSRIEREITKRGGRWFRAIALAAASNAMACSSGDEIVLRVTRDAEAPEIVTCNPTERFAPDVGLDVYVILDRSNQFGDVNWFERIKPALSAVFLEPEFAGINLGIALYPMDDKRSESCAQQFCGALPTCGCLRNCDCESWSQRADGGCDCAFWQTSCTAADYTPFVEIAPLREGSQFALMSSKVQTEGAASLSAALYGALRYRNEWKATHGGREITQLLLAGTSFDLCDDEDNDSFEESERALSGADKPKTYIATYDEPESDYDRLAIAGRTETVWRMRPPPRLAGPPAAEMLELFRKIRDAEGRCEYLLPEPLGTLDYRKVNLASPIDGTVYRRVPDAQGCGSTPMGWYYDTPIADRPTRILACPDTCKNLHAWTGTATAQIQLGCPTLGSDGGT